MLAHLWGGQDWPVDKVENEDFEQALKDDLTLHGKFNLNEDGTMQIDDFLSFRAAIIRQQVRKNY